MLKSGTTPDLEDLFTQDGVRQVVVALGKMRPGDVADVARESVKEAWKDVKSTFTDLIKLPKLPW
jgi:hypothetical protein